jgi:hypothetical protein
MTDEVRAGPPAEEREAPGQGQVQGQGQGQVQKHAEGHPRGTLFLMLLFLVSIAAMWAYMYVLLLERG